MRLFRRLIAALLSCVLLAGCWSTASQEPIQYVIGVSQANMREPWRLVLTHELKEEAARYPNLRLVFTDATQNTSKQIKDIERLEESGIDLLIVSPSDVGKLTPIISKVYQKIPVIVLDRVVDGFDYSLFIGPDNRLIGRQAGEVIMGLIDSSGGKVLELMGGTHAQASADRNAGFREIADQGKNILTDRITISDESRDSAEEALLSMGSQLSNYDVIFAHNDYMALGASRAIEKLGLQGIHIIGIDGFSGEDGGLDLVSTRRIDATIVCPTGGKDAILNAMDILNHVSGVPKQIILRSRAVTYANLPDYESSLSKPTVETPVHLRVGYAQVGHEGEWRAADNKSITNAARDAGIDLITIDANQSQKAQINAIREFIRQKVDVIVLSPVVNSGWDEVLQEARDAGIPVLLSDRMIDTTDRDLYETYIGADFLEEGRRAMRWVQQNAASTTRNTRIMEIRGSEGASPTIERGKGFREVLSQGIGFRITYSASGGYTRQGGYEVVERYLSSHNSLDEDVIFCHNDDMALGAAQALREHGIKPGIDVKIVSVDGTKEALQALQDGSFNCVVECSPLLGPQLMKAIKDLKSGKELPLRIITDETVFTKDTPADKFRNRKY